jgi:hypothetical protein
MNLRNLFRVFAVLYFLTGLYWLLAPKGMATSFGLEVTPYAEILVQSLGAVNISFAVLAFLVSGMAHSPARQAVVTTFILYSLLSGIVLLLAVFRGAMPGSAGWLGIIPNLLFIVAFGYFRFIRPEENVTPGLES